MLKRTIVNSTRIDSTRLDSTAYRRFDCLRYCTAHPCASWLSKRVIHAAQTHSSSLPLSSSQARCSTLISSLARVQCRRARANGAVIRNDGAVCSAERYRDQAARVNEKFFHSILLLLCIDVNFLLLFLVCTDISTK